MTRRHVAIPSNMNGTHKVVRRNPYDGLREVIAKAEAGLLLPEHVAKARGVELTPIPLATPGQRIAQRLIEMDNPLTAKVITACPSERETRTTQQSGSRYLARNGFRHWRLSYRRGHTEITWRIKPVKKEN